MTGQDDLDLLAAEHVMGLLEGEEAARAERLLQDDGAFGTAVAHWRERFSDLDASTVPERAGDKLWRRIEDAIEAPTQAAAVPTTPVIVPDPLSAFKALWRNLAFWRVAGLAGGAATLLLAVGLGLVASQRASTPVLVAVLMSEGSNRPAAVVNAFADGRTELVPLENIAVPPDRALEIWTLWDRARGPVSVGLLDQARSLRLKLDNLPAPARDQLFEITLEPKTGSPTGRPTGPVLMKGTTSTAL